MLECDVQCCKLKGWDAFFGLERTVFESHPLYSALAHKRRVKPMRTGSRCAGPKSFSADHNEPLSSVLSETQLSNFAKMEFDNAHYTGIFEDISKGPWGSHFHYIVPNPVPSITFLHMHVRV
jgi:hypothetical protein